MAKIPFDIKYRPQIESGEYKVETSDGYPARIICWDSPIDEDRPIICIVFDNQIEQYKADGRFRYDYEPCNYDLFIITPEPELSEFENKVADVIDLWHADYEQWTKPGASAHNYKNQIKQDAAELLALARKEIEKELPKWFQVEKDGCFDKPHKFLLDTKEGMFFCSGEIVPRDGYALFVDNLLGLPRVDIKP